ncbi:MAG: DUF4011 domain-containing protein [Nocardiaceae bacterium]|nr:DUF4011 domain-containing protein [Nocardiaceae bacterium]
MVIGQGHAFVGYLTADEQLPAVVIDDLARLQTIVDSNLFDAFEATAVCTGPGHLGFDAARAEVRHWWREDLHKLRYLLDVRAAHSRVRPLPTIRMDGDTRVIEIAPHQPAAVARRAPGEVVVGPASVVPPRVDRWKRALLDMTYANALLKLKAASSVPIHVPSGALGEFEDGIASDQRFELQPHDMLSAIHLAQGARTAADVDAQTLSAVLLSERTAYVAVAEKDYHRRILSLARRAKTALEETGTSSLYLAFGTLEWTERAQQGRAPLYLVPVKLLGGKGNTAFQIQLDPTRDLEPNYCLIEKLRVSWGIEIPDLLNPSEDHSGIDLPRALEAVRASILRKRVEGFHVQETAHLALLQFATLQLWQDLSNNWQSFLDRPTVRHLVHSAGSGFDDSIEPPDADPSVEATTYLPIPADGSQLEAIRWASAGKSFVLEGPPGTGKSQTITNLIANGLAEGKRVLFVAEKAAALDIVKGRLASVGLDAFSLDLHGPNQTVTAVRQQLQDALDHSIAPTPAFDQLRRNYQGLVAGLARYPDQLHEVGPIEMSAWDARQIILELEEMGPTSATDIPRSVVLGEVPIEEVYDIASRLGESLLDLGVKPMQSPWRLAGPIDVDTLDRSGLQTKVSAVAATRRSVTDPSVLSLLSFCRTLEQLDAVSSWLGAASYGVAHPAAEAASICTPQWEQAADHTVRRVEQFTSHFTPVLRNFSPEVLGVNLDALLRWSEETDGRLLGKKKRRLAILAEVQAFIDGPPQFPLDQLTSVLRELVGIRQGIAQLNQEVAQLPGVQVLPGWNPLDRLEARYVHAQVAGLRASASLHRVSSGASDSATADILRLRSPQALGSAPALSAFAAAWRELLSALASQPADVEFWLQDRYLLPAIDEDISSWNADGAGAAFVRLRRWGRVRSGLENAKRVGLRGLEEPVRSGELKGGDLEREVRLGIAKAVLSERLDSTGLAGFDDAERGHQIDRFIKTGLDVRRRMVTELPARLVHRRTFDSRGSRGRIGDLRQQLGRRRGGLSIRQLLHRFPDIIPQVTPCFLMSPASVARFLPAEMEFDLVVFDEASQIRVPQAICAMGRGKAVVIVGDSKQMPPTSMFSATSTDEEEEMEADDGLPVPVDLESVLSEAVESGFPSRLLSWHYRSRDESLIAFSNQYYYDGRLSSFPMPPDVGGQGLRLVRVDGEWEGGGRGAARVNRSEAKAVVEEIHRILDEDPGYSIGVVTFNSQQQTLVLDMLEADGDSRVRDALEREDEPLFVKNLENVQGDERDIILFTLAFSKDSKGRVPLNWGPLTRAGGERRLNVAVTRAKRQVAIFSSFDPHELDLGGSSSRGLADLKDYLLLARNGVAHVGLRRPSTLDRHLEEIADRLRSAGLEVATRVGLSDFTVDLAVRSGDKPWIAVLLDGPEWAQRATVGDRESLPSAVLTGAMGWPQVVRIWLPTWVRDSDSVVDAVREAASSGAAPAMVTADAMIAAEPEVVEESAPVLVREEAVVSNAFVPADDRPRYDPAGLEIPAMVAAEAVKVVEEEGPIMADRLIKVVASRFDLGRVREGRWLQIRNHFPPGLLKKAPNNEFVAWPAAMDPAEYLDYRTGKRDILEVPYHELRNALVAAVRSAHGLSREDALRETAKAFEGTRLASKVRPRLEGVIMAAEREGVIVDREGLILEP